MTPRRSYRRVRLVILALLAAVPVTAGCRQKMADQPYFRPYEPTPFFADGRSNRPLERGVIHRGQYLETDPMATGLTQDEWARYYKHVGEGKALPVPEMKGPKVDYSEYAKALAERNREIAFGAPRFAPTDATKVYVEAFPFRITADDLNRGQQRYTIYCAPCHGVYGNGQGKIWERGYLEPTSFHTRKAHPSEVDTPENPQGTFGHSRGYWIPWGISVPMDKVPVGYYFEVITKGYAGMPSYSAQIPPDDRWRIIAYIRALQLSVGTDTPLPPELQKKLDEAGGKK